MTPRRIERVNHVLREELARLIARSVKDPRVAPVTIMEVRTSRDLKVAKVFVRAGSDEETLADALTGLRSAEGYLRRELGRRLRARFLPLAKLPADLLPSRPRAVPPPAFNR